MFSNYLLTTITVVLLYCIKWELFAANNVLFVVFDDLRPALGGYNDPWAKTPHLDNILVKGHYFTRAYSQQALCAPSRNSLLTSRRPDSLHLYDFYSYWRTTAGNFTTLPQYLKDNGYYTYSVGKIFHPGVSSNHTDDYPFSWSTTSFHGSSEQYMNGKVCTNDGDNDKRYWNLICPVNVIDQPLRTLPDIQSTQEAIRFLKNFTGHKQNPNSHEYRPYFLAVGYHKPHINFRFPRHYLERFPVESFYNYTMDVKKPKDMPNVAWNPYNDLRERDDIKHVPIPFPYGPIPEEVAARIRQAYYASVSYVDDQFGELMRYVNLNDTIIVILGDHGWSLGEHTEWAKYSNFEVAVKVPLIIYTPEVTHSIRGGHRIENLVELVDLFPSLIDLLHLPRIPNCTRGLNHLNLCTEGTSFYSLLMPGAAPTKKTAAFSQFPRPGIVPTVDPDSDTPRLHEIKIMGYSLRTIDYRYTLWIQFNAQNFTRDWSDVYGEELYDHRFNDHETDNLIYDPKFNTTRYSLRKLLKNFFVQSTGNE